MPKLKILIIVFVLILLLAIFLPGYAKLQKLKGINQSLTEQVEKLTMNKVQLADEIEKLKKDISYVEEIVRKKMGLSKKGEVIYKLHE